MASSFIALCKGRGCCAVRTFSVRVVLGTVKRGEIEDYRVRGRCPQCHRMKEGIVRKEPA